MRVVRERLAPAGTCERCVLPVSPGIRSDPASRFSDFLFLRRRLSVLRIGSQARMHDRLQRQHHVLECLHECHTFAVVLSSQPQVLLRLLRQHSLGVPYYSIVSAAALAIVPLSMRHAPYGAESAALYPDRSKRVSEKRQREVAARV